MVRSTGRSLKAFSRDRLLLDIHASCNHRETAVTDAPALVDDIIAALVRTDHKGVLERQQIVQIVRQVLGRFDQVAATVYDAYHPAG